MVLFHQARTHFQRPVNNLCSLPWHATVSDLLDATAPCEQMDLATILRASTLSCSSVCVFVYSCPLLRCLIACGDSTISVEFVRMCNRT